MLDTLVGGLEGVTLSSVMAEAATPEDFEKGDKLLLACGTWNTGSIEGQLNPHMHALLLGRAKDVDLKGKEVFVLGLGDTRYRYTCKAADRLIEFVNTHNGKLVGPEFRMINEPYGQEKSVTEWSKHLLKNLK